MLRVSKQPELKSGFLFRHFPSLPQSLTFPVVSLIRKPGDSCPCVTVFLTAALRERKHVRTLRLLRSVRLLVWPRRHLEGPGLQAARNQNKTCLPQGWTKNILMPSFFRTRMRSDLAEASTLSVFSDVEPTTLHQIFFPSLSNQLLPASLELPTFPPAFRIRSKGIFSLEESKEAGDRFKGQGLKESKGAAPGILRYTYWI